MVVRRLDQVAKAVAVTRGDEECSRSVEDDARAEVMAARGGRLLAEDDLDVREAAKSSDSLPRITLVAFLPSSRGSAKDRKTSRVCSKFGWSAMSRSPPWPTAAISGRPVIGSETFRSRPMVRSAPAFSVTRITPSGKKAKDHGRSRPSAMVSSMAAETELSSAFARRDISGTAKQACENGTAIDHRGTRLVRSQRLNAAVRDMDVRWRRVQALLSDT